MPTYEVSLIMKKMARPQLVDALKRAATHIYTSGGYIRRMESLGHRELPNKKKKNMEWHSEGTYFIMEADLTVKSIDKIKDEYGRDEAIIQKTIMSKELEVDLVCPKNLDQELLPPSERPSVKKLLEEGRRPPRFRKIWDPRTGLDYYPFRK